MSATRRIGYSLPDPWPKSEAAEKNNNPKTRKKEAEVCPGALTTILVTEPWARKKIFFSPISHIPRDFLGANLFESWPKIALHTNDLCFVSEI
jgi:hypothetical protein